MPVLLRSVLVFFALCMLPACTAEQPSPAPHTDNADAQIENLALSLTGQFDSRRQMEADKAENLTEEAAHGWVNRVFVQVDAPEIGNQVLVGSTRYGGPPWRFDEAEFLVWTFQPSDDGQKIIMSPRRFKDQESRISHAQDPDKLAGFGPEDLEPAIGGAACDVVWTETPSGFSARTLPCSSMSTTQKQELSWEWSYRLEKDAMWVEFTGADPSGKIVYQTPVDSPYRLDRIN